MERLARKIIDMLDDVRMTKNDLDYLAWHLIWQAPKPMQKRMVFLADAIIRHNYEIEETNDDQYTLF
jgi:hypothetical protein